MFDSRMQLKSSNIQMDAVTKTTTQLADHGYHDLANRLWDNAVAKMNNMHELDKLVGQTIADPYQDHTNEALELERKNTQLAYQQAELFQEMLQQAPEIYMSYHYQELESFKTWVNETDTFG